ncbi:hypothetical protein Theos_1309 [Thermus oshimai JL-2]|uniref:DUF3987 domain-containing protein n=1 Tax=Thermus oshimai JL-2 TaxID=751945 RepID=K7QV89_THEOS|nr:DUF3987 domain-containing protein [Thermus oshimai]AFV76346.1 hypothetical protein Theos_1309 [Thermus oshimai JL-2]
MHQFTIEDLKKLLEDAPEVKKEDLGVNPSPQGENSEGWPIPAPLETLETNLPSWHTGIVPPAIEDFAIGLARQLAISPTAPAMVALGAISAILAHRGVEIYPNPNNPTHKEVPVLWVVLIGDPGSGKTPTLESATQPLWDIEDELAKENQRALEEYEAQLAKWAATPKGKRGEKPTPPPAQSLVEGDATPQALAIALTENLGVAVVLDELKGLLLSWSRDDRAEGRTLFLSSYYGQRHKVRRVVRGISYLERPQIVLLTGIQPGPWYELVAADAFSANRDTDGFLERITPILMEPKQPEKDPPPLDEKVLERYRDLIRGLWEGGVPTRLTPDSKAYKLWREVWYDSLTAARSKAESTPWKAYLSKKPGLVARLAGILAVAWGEVLITESAMSRAILLVETVLEPHIKVAWRIGGVANLGPAYRLAKYLKGKHQKGEGIRSFTRREVYTKGWGNIQNSKEADQALRALEVAGWVRYDPRTRCYLVNPRLGEVGMDEG